MSECLRVYARRCSDHRPRTARTRQHHYTAPGGCSQLPQLSSMHRNRAFFKKTRKGKILRVVSDHYLRDDIGCGSLAGKPVSNVSTDDCRLPSQRPRRDSANMARCSLYKGLQYSIPAGVTRSQLSTQLCTTSTAHPRMLASRPSCRNDSAADSNQQSSWHLSLQVGRSNVGTAVVVETETLRRVDAFDTSPYLYRPCLVLPPLCVKQDNLVQLAQESVMKRFLVRNNDGMHGLCRRGL